MPLKSNAEDERPNHKKATQESDSSSDLNYKHTYISDVTKMAITSQLAVASFLVIPHPA